MLSQTDGLGNTTTYGYDSLGFQDEVIDPNGDVTDTGHDLRGNVVATTTCQNQAAGKCSTSYASYSPDDNATELTAPYSGNDLVTSFRDARSSSATDSTYLTTNTYNTAGELASTNTPPVPGYPSGRITTYSYTDGTTTAGGAQTRNSRRRRPGCCGRPSPPAPRSPRRCTTRTATSARRSTATA